MDVFLARFGVQAVNYAIRSSIALTMTFAVGQCSRLLKTIDDRGLRAELNSLQDLLESKIQIITPALDLIEFKSGHGNLSLKAAVPLASSLRQDILALGKRMEEAAAAQEDFLILNSHRLTVEAHHGELVLITRDIKELVARIDRDVHYLTLAISTSGESLSSSISSGVSPSRLLQASTLLTFGDTQFAHDPTRPVQIGPSFALSLYMLFIGHASRPSSSVTNGPPTPMTPSPAASPSRGQQEPYGFGEGERRPIWQEVLHKARVRLCRVPAGWEFDFVRGYDQVFSTNSVVETGDFDTDNSQAWHFGDYNYHVEIIEDLDDGRLHEDEDSKPFDDISRAGIRESITIPEISKIFYADTGRILNIGGSDTGGASPVLLLKRTSESRRVSNTPDEQCWGTEETVANNGKDMNNGYRPFEDKVNKQIQAEYEPTERASIPEPDSLRLKLPPHLDPDWLAFEAFVEDDDSESSSVDEEDEEDYGNKTASIRINKTRAQQRSSLDPGLISQIRNVSIRDSAATSPASKQLDKAQMDSEESFVARSPFGGIVSSLSLLEMLIRLTSLQQHEQKPHLTTRDTTLNFFLDETSTTGLNGEERWRARHEAKRRVGFDPYTDTPTK